MVGVAVVVAVAVLVQEGVLGVAGTGCPVDDDLSAERRGNKGAVALVPLLGVPATELGLWLWLLLCLMTLWFLLLL